MSEPRRIDIPLATVERLIVAQFPAWAALPLKPVPTMGTDNAIFRLGEDLAVRMPRVEWAVPQVEKEQVWLPRLAPLLPLPIPKPLALGEPGEGYPWPWTVCRWVAGEPVASVGLADEAAFVADLAGFLQALRTVDATHGPRPGRHNFRRGAPLSERDARVRASLDEFAPTHDTRRLAALWDAALAVPVWKGPPVWIHGDVQATNLLVQDGRLCGVIDFGGLGVGDPACDLMVAWSLLSPAARAALRELAGLDEDAWSRGRGWALSAAVIALPYYRERQPAVAWDAQRTLDAVLADGDA